MFYECIPQISISTLKRFKFFVPNKITSGVLRWSDYDIAISVTVDNIKRVAVFDYLIVNNNRRMSYEVPIYEAVSNIGKGVVRYMRCPITHALCRKLYLCDGVFVSRKAIRGAIYQCQARSKLERAMPNGFACDDFIPYKRYGKPYYRGKLTPYGKRIVRYQNIANKSLEYLCGRVQRLFMSRTHLA